MKLKELENILFKSSSDLMKKEGKEASEKGLVSSIKAKKIGDVYHIYGRVDNKLKTKQVITHIKINVKNKKLEGITCTCDDFHEICESGYEFMCSHLNATAYEFLKLAYKNIKKSKNVKKNDSCEQERKSESAVRIVRKAIENPPYYESFIAPDNKKIKIEEQGIRRFLESVCDKKIKFKYDYLEINTSVIKKDIPITFNLKDRDNCLVLTTQKKFPISLTSKNDAFLFNWNIYLPREMQCYKLAPLLEKLKVKGEIIYKKNKNNYDEIISLLTSISNNINLSEGVKRFAEDLLKPEFYIYKEENNIYCCVNILYGDKKINILHRDKSKDMSIRDYRKEDKILMEIEKCKFMRRKDKLMFIGEEDELFDIVSNKGKNINSLGNVVFGKGMDNIKIYNSSHIEGSLNEEDGYYKLSYNIKGIENSELSSMFNAYKQNKKFYKLKDNNFIDFEDEGVTNLFSMLKTLNFSDDLESGFLKVEVSKGLYLNEFIKDNRIKFIRGKDVLENIENKIIDKKHVSIPDKLEAVLREYQVSGFKWLKNLGNLGFGGILADEMGLGKTIQTIAFLLSEENKKSIIISPTSLVYNWKDEIERFAPSLKAAVVHGKKENRNELIDNLKEYDVLLTTYGTLKLDIDKYKDINFDYCVIDEGQYIKNPKAQITKAIKKINSRVRFALTGTPIENNLMELWSIFDFIMPDYLYSKEKFLQKFILEEDNLEGLKLLIKPFILRRTKKEVIKELPDKIEKKFLVQMTPAQKAVYKTYVKAIKEKMKNNADGRIEVFSYLTKLRQICLDPSLIIDEYAGGSGKVKVAMNLIDDHMEHGGKVLLFSQFTSVLKNIGENLKEKGISYFTLDGSTNPKERIRMVDEFNKSKDINVFLISLKAGGTGLNLTGANLVIHFDPWWNPAVENQATDRAHRIGQKDVVEVIKLVAKGTIEEKIISLQEDKKDLIQSVITGELKNSSSLYKLSKEELMEIFQH